MIDPMQRVICKPSLYYDEACKMWWKMTYNVQMLIINLKLIIIMKVSVEPSKLFICVEPAVFKGIDPMTDHSSQQFK